MGREAARGWVVAGTLATVLAVSSGARFLFGVVLVPLTAEFGWARGDLATAAALNFALLACLQPLVGWAADRWGARRVILAGVAATTLVVVPLTFADRLWQVYLLYGIVAGVAFAATSSVGTNKLLNDWFDERRGLALSLGTSGQAVGQVAVVPIATAIVAAWGWRAACWAVAALGVGVMLPLAFAFLREAPRRAGPRPAAAPIGATLARALRRPLAWQLAFGLFACGFTMSFTSVHLVAYLLDMPDYGRATMQQVASGALATVGVCSIAGALLLGHLADRHGRRPMLAATYFLRGLAFVILLLAGANLSAIALGAIVLGISWTATTPLTSAICADAFGREALGTVYGAIYIAMHLGSGAGAFVAGLDFDLTGNYRLALLLNGLLGFAAAAAILAARSGAARRGMRAAGAFGG